MNKDQMQGNWKQLKGKVKEHWGKLTDNDLTAVEGNMDQLAGRVQERYGIQRDEAEKQIKEFRQRNEDLWP
ncbi:MAG TPA: CsbD family protein [Dongiaceae bacterium]